MGAWMGWMLLVLPLGPAQGVEVSVRAVVTPGQKPAVVVTAKQGVANAVLHLTRGDGVILKQQTGKLRAQAKKELSLNQGLGSAHYEGSLTVSYPGVEETQSLALSFDAHVLAPPQLALDPADVLLEDHKVLVTLNRECAHVSYTIYGDSGEVIDRGDSPFDGAKAGEKLPLVWNGNGAAVIRMDIVGYDVHGLFSPMLSIFPWSLDIPHEDVNFDTGQAIIPAGEQDKVSHALVDIQTAVKRYSGVVKMTLFVAGHTDTVGSSQSNRTLSQARAAAIGKALRSGGLRIPIKVHGFGEDSLKVDTPDETPQAENRRAQYTLSVQDPAVTGGGGSWRALP